MRGGIPPFPNMPSWRGACLSNGNVFTARYLVKNRNTFAFSSNFEYTYCSSELYLQWPSCPLITNINPLLRNRQYTEHRNDFSFCKAQHTPQVKCFKQHLMRSIIQVKVKLPLCLTKHHARNTYGSEGIAPRILNLSTRWR